MSKTSLKDHLSKLNDSAPRTIDPESAYASLDSLKLPNREGDEGREHYLDVGPSSLRKSLGGQSAQTLLGDKYGGKTVGRMKIFDDDDDEEDDDKADQMMDGPSDEEDEDEGDAEDGEEAEEDEKEDVDDDDDEEEEDDEGEGEGEDEDEDVEVAAAPATAPTTSKSRALDPLSSLRESRVKDIEKGRGIRRQKALFDTLLTLRITYQKALTASTTLSLPLPSDPSGELEATRREALKSLAALNEQLLEIRSALILPGSEMPQLGKRKRGDGEVDEDYLVSAGQDSLALSDAQHPHMLGILNKWSNKINAASMTVNSKAAGSSKFLQGTKGQVGVVEAIEAGLANKRESGRTFIENEEMGYRLLLKEVIESRSGGGGADLSHLRREKKKKRDAERGASKGRKIRYTVHEKAQNFVVPIQLRRGWDDTQMDELFSSLLGGAGMTGGNAETNVSAAVGGGEDGLTSLGGLRVF